MKWDARLADPILPKRFFASFTHVSNGIPLAWATRQYARECRSGGIAPRARRAGGGDTALEEI